MPASNATVTATYTDSGGGSNLLVNGDFEFGNNGSWSLGNNCSIISNSSEARNGSYALRIIANGSWPHAAQSVDVVDSHEYEISGYIRSDGISGQAPRFRIRWYSASNSLLLTKVISGSTGTTGYLRYSLTSTPPANSVRLEVAPMLSAKISSGTAWFDDILVVDLDE
jgi:hypothetical protein